MTGIEQRIAEVLRDHRTQGWNVTASAPMCSCGDSGEYMAHIAAAVVAELQLTEETQFRHAFGQGDAIERRWTTGWEKAE